VGFIRKLPAQLVHSFASTLEAARAADVRVLCADASSEDLSEEISMVAATLSETLGKENGSADASTILCLNKVDLLSEGRIRELRSEYPEAVMISALAGCEELLHEIYASISSERQRITLLIPHSEYAAASHLYGLAEIHARESTPDGVRMDVSLPPSSAPLYAAYRITDNTSHQQQG
jgi:GTP-binding protein HflX